MCVHVYTYIHKQVDCAHTQIFTPKKLTLHNDFQVTFPLLPFWLSAFPPFQSALYTQAGALYIALKWSGVFKNASLFKFCWKQLQVEGLQQSGPYRNSEGRQGAEAAAQVNEGKGFAGMDFPWHFYNCTDNFCHVLSISLNHLPTPAAFSTHIWAFVGLFCDTSLVCLAYAQKERDDDLDFLLPPRTPFPKTQHRIISVVCLNRWPYVLQPLGLAVVIPFLWASTYLVTVEDEHARWDLVGRDHPRGQGAHAADPLTSRCLNLLQRSESKQRLITDTESNTKATLSHLPQISFSVLLPQALKSFNPHLSGGHVNFNQKLIK